MKLSGLRTKIASQWGVSSDEFKSFLKIIEKAEAWDKYEYEKYGLGIHHEKLSSSGANEPIADHTPAPLLPSSREIARATWTYFLARAGWIMVVWITFLIVMTVGFAISWLAMM